MLCIETRNFATTRTLEVSALVSGAASGTRKTAVIPASRLVVPLGI